MRRALTFGVVVVVVAAGLASAGGVAIGSHSDGSGDAGNGSELAPGVTRAGVSDPLALARAHDRVLRNESYTVTDAATHHYRNGTLLGTWTSTTAVAADGEAFDRRNYGTYRNGSGLHAVTHYERHVWSNGSTTLISSRHGDGAVEYERRDDQATPRQRPDTRWEAVYAAFSAVNTTVVGEVERDGTTLYRVVATGVRPDSGYADARPFSLTALVDERGVVHSLSYSHATTYQDRPSFVTQEIRVTAVGNTTIERPSWHDAAVENATST